MSVYTYRGLADQLLELQAAEVSMSTIALFEVDQSGDVGGPGLARWAVLNIGSSGVLSGAELNTTAAAILAFYTAIKAHLQSNLLYSVSNIAKIIDEATGGITAQEPITTVGSVAGSAIGIYAAGTGARLYWHTNTVRGRRLVRGATYICPLDSGSFSNLGTVSATVVSLIQSAANTYLTTMAAASLTPVVYCRPHPKGATNGTHASITAASVTNKVSSLRSRRS